jgi:sugar phosphate isomerase/epimerase
VKRLNRRSFIGRSAKTLGAAWALAQLPGWVRANGAEGVLNIPLGFQTFPIRNLLAKDFPGTLKTMSGLGYQLVEMCSPKGYAAIGFGSLVNMKTSEMKSIIQDAGLSCPSCHFGFSELTSQLDDRMEFARQLGLSQMICSTFWLPASAKLKDYQDAAAKLNAIAEKIKKAGMQTGFHNHDMEFAKLEGELIYDVLMKSFDPDLVKMQFQTEVINQGYKASTYFTKYPGRFISSHLSDWTADKKETAIGQGVIDWPEYFRAAKTGGVKNFFVEMDFDKFKDSSGYIHGL